MDLPSSVTTAILIGCETWEIDNLKIVEYCGKKSENCQNKKKFLKNAGAEARGSPFSGSEWTQCLHRRSCRLWKVIFDPKDRGLGSSSGKVRSADMLDRDCL